MGATTKISFSFGVSSFVNLIFSFLTTNGLVIAESGRFRITFDLKNKSTIKHQSVIVARNPLFKQCLFSCRPYLSISMTLPFPNQVLAFSITFASGL